MKKKNETYKEVQQKFLGGPAVEKNKMLQKEIHIALSREELLVSPEPGIYARLGKYLKIFSYLVLFTGFGLVANSCVGYVESEPTYGVEIERPSRPGDDYIWIDGGWRWNYHNHSYIHQRGYWEKPRQGYSYQEGHWQNSPRGKSWVNGHWQRREEQREHHDR